MFIVFYRTLVFYLLLIVVMRLLGKRQIGQMEPSEFVVTMLIANLACIPMEEPERPILDGIIPILTILALELILSLAALRSIRLRKLLCGKPVIVIENGKILPESLRKNRITLDELTGHLRQKDVMDISDVQYAILETNGNLSVFPYPMEKPASARDTGIPVKEQYLPLTVISDGKLLKENLEKAGKDEAWLQTVLKNHNATKKNTWLLTVNQADEIRFFPK